jgi:hypothetical protein
VFEAGAIIPIEVSAEDPDGEIVRLELRSGDTVLANAEGSPLQFEWKDAYHGMHRFTALAVDDDHQQSVSRPVVIYVRDPARTTSLRIRASRPEARGKVRLRAEAPFEQVFVVEGSSNLVHWSEIGAHMFTDEEIELSDPAAVTGASHRYYRLRPVGR